MTWRVCRLVLCPYCAPIRVYRSVVKHGRVVRKWWLGESARERAIRVRLRGDQP